MTNLENVEMVYFGERIKLTYLSVTLILFTYLSCSSTKFLENENQENLIDENQLKNFDSNQYIHSFDIQLEDQKLFFRLGGRLLGRPIRTGIFIYKSIIPYILI